MAWTDEIYAVAAIFASSDREENAALRTLCAAAETELKTRLRKGVSQEDCRESFICAAAMLAAGHYMTAQNGTVKSFTAGDVSVTTSGGNRAAEDLRTQAELLMRPFCVSGFSFLGVRS